MRFRIEDLEDRIVLDAALVDADGGDDADADDAVPVVVPDAPAADATDANPNVLLISSRVHDADALAAAAQDGAVVIQYDAASSTPESLLAAVRGALGDASAASIGIATHDAGADGFRLTDALEVNLDTLSDHAGFWQDLAGLVGDGGRIDLLACDLAAGADGAALVDALESLTGVDFAASTDATGNLDGADWILETDHVDLTDVYFDSDMLNRFVGQLSGGTPTIFTSPPTDALEGSSYEYVASASDPEGDALSWHVVTEQVDQSCAGGTPTPWSSSSGWQSFTAGSDGWLTSVELAQNSNTVTRILRIYTGEGTGGTLLYEQTFAAGGQSGWWRDFEFDDAIALQGGQKYTVSFTGVGGGISLFANGIGDQYAGGRMDLLSTFDYMFKTHMAVSTDLPDWMSLTDQGNGQAILSGTPDASDLGDHGIQLLVSDGTTAAMQSFSVDVNDLPEAVSISRDDDALLTSGSASYTVTFDEAVTGVDADDFLLTAAVGVTGNIASVSGSGTTWTVTVDGISGEGSLRLDLVDNDTIRDLNGAELGGPGQGNGSLAGEAYVVDTLGPMADVVDVTPDPISGNAGTVTIRFHEDVSGVDLSDFALTHDGVAVDLSGLTLTAVSAQEYQLDLSSVTTAEGAYQLTLSAAGSGIVDAAGNALAADVSDAWINDTTAPTVALDGILPALRPASPGSIGIVFSENVTGLDLADFSLVRDGEAVSLAGAALIAVSGSEYTLDLSGIGTESGNYTLTLLNSGIADAAGNALADGAATGWTVDATAPTAAFDAVMPLSNAVPAVTLRLSEAVDGLDLSDLALMRDGASVDLSGAVLTQTDATTYSLDLSGLALEDGSYELTLAAAGSGIVDQVGNALATGASLAWTLDTAGPTADVEEVLPDPNNQDAGLVSVWFSEAVDGVDISDFTLTRDGQAVDLTGVVIYQHSAAEYELDLTFVTNTEGHYVLTVHADGSQIVDLAGNALTADASDAWTTDMTGPAADIVDVTPDLRNALVDQVTVRFSEDVTGLDAGDFVLMRDGATVDLSGVTLEQISGTEYVLHLGDAAQADGQYQLRLVAGTSGVLDNVGNPLFFDAVDAWRMDGTAPTAQISDVADGNVAAGVVQISFSEAVDGFDLSDLVLTRDGAVVDLSGAVLTQVSAAQYALDLTSVAGVDGAYLLTLTADGSITDAAGNAFAAATTEAWASDLTAPTATLSAVADGTVPADSVRITFSEAVDGLDLSDLVLMRDGVAVDLSGAALNQISATEYDLSLAAAAGADGSYILTLKADGSVTDAAGNAFATEVSEDWTTDGTAPTVSIEPVNAVDAPAGLVTITFSEGVGGVDIGDFVLTLDGQVIDISGLNIVKVSDSVYQIDLSSVTNADGSYVLTLAPDGSIADAAGNALVLGAETTWTADVTAPEVVAVTRVDSEVGTDGTAAYTVTFSEAVTGVDITDFVLATTGSATGTIQGVATTDGLTYTVTVSDIGGDGTLRLDVLDDGSIQDAVGHDLGGDGSDNGGFISGESYTVQEDTGPVVDPGWRWSWLHRLIVHIIREIREHIGLHYGLHMAFGHGSHHGGHGFSVADQVHQAHNALAGPFGIAARGLGGHFGGTSHGGSHGHGFGRAFRSGFRGF